MALNDQAPSAGDPIRVMVVDDSAVVRGLITRMLEEDPAITVTASVGNGQMAISALERHSIDVVVLDIEMPVMDGLTALPRMLQMDPGLQVIMASTLTLRNAEISMKAMEAGAADYIPKPTSSRDISGGGDFKHELLEKVRTLGNVRRRGGIARRPAATSSAAAARPAPVAPRPAAAPRAPIPLHPGPIVLRQPGNDPADVIAIGSSTGGPQALFSVLGALRTAGLRQPILITQHMPATFTTILAEHISRQCGLAAAEAKDGEPIAQGRVYIAPGDFHMLVAQRGGQNVLQLTKDPPENFCRPAVDPMMRSIVKAYGARKVLACILTGMGQDGLRGCTEVVNQGGVLIGQDEASSVVWGMPGAVAQAGLCSAILPLKEIGPTLRKLAARA